jgi:hypothetical protein
VAHAFTGLSSLGLLSSYLFPFVPLSLLQTIWNMTNGSCLCGAVQISTKSESTSSVVCGCTHCQHCSGSAFTVNLVYPKDSIEVTKGQDQLKAYEGLYFSLPS